MPTAFRSRILGYARAIASMRYPASILVNGLQPLDDWLDERGVLQPGLLSKYAHELIEFRQAKQVWISEQTEESRGELLAEAADLVYYACQIDEQGQREDTLEDTLVNLAGPTSQVSTTEAKIACQAKYSLRSARPDSKDKELERIVILAAVNALPKQGGLRQNQPGRRRKTTFEPPESVQSPQEALWQWLAQEYGQEASERAHLLYNEQMRRYQKKKRA